MFTAFSIAQLPYAVKFFISIRTKMKIRVRVYRILVLIYASDLLPGKCSIFKLLRCFEASCVSNLKVLTSLISVKKTESREFLSSASYLLLSTIQ